MKKFFVLIFIVLLPRLMFPADFKIMAGLSLSISSEPMSRGDIVYLFPPHAEFGAGFVGGGGIEFSLARNLALEADALFFQKGSQIRYEMSALAPVMARINELSIPILIKVFLRPRNSAYILGGGEIAFVLTDGPKRVDFGLVGGIGYRKHLKRFSMSLEARYHHGLQDMLPDEVVLGYGVRKMRAFSLMLGFSI